MQKILLTLVLCLLSTASVYALGGGGSTGGGNIPGGSGVPEPASILLIIGGAAALTIKGLLNRKK